MEGIEFSRGLFEIQVRQFVHRARQHRFVSSNHDWSLQEFGMFSHDLNELIVRQFPVRYILPISVFFGTQSIVGSQAGLLQ
jgi:hypothetical protein